jgi:hypothetical protein
MKRVTPSWLGALGLKLGRIRIAIDGDPAKGGAEIEEDQDHLPLIDRLAICVAGIDAQDLFEVEGHAFSGMSDMGRVCQLVGDDFSEREALGLRNAGYDKAREKLVRHLAKVEAVANALAKAGELDQQALEILLNGNPPT